MKYKDYLAINELENTDEIRKIHYPIFRRLRNNQSQRKHRKKVKRIEFKVENEFYGKLQDIASQLKISVQKLLQTFFESYFEYQSYIFISHELSRKIQRELVREGTNLNQLQKAINSRPQNTIYKSDMEGFKKVFRSLENKYLSFCTPINIEDFLRKENEKYSGDEFLRQVRIMIEAIEQENSNHQHNASN